GLQPWTWSTIATPGYLPASPLLIRLPTTGLGPARPCPVAPKGRWTGLGGEHHRARYGRLFASRRISTPCPSTTPVGLALGPDLPRADYPGPGTLGHSADGFLTRLSLLMPAFSLVWPPPLGSPAASPPTRRSPTHLRLWTTKAGVERRCHGFGGVLEPRYIVGAESLDQ